MASSAAPWEKSLTAIKQNCQSRATAAPTGTSTGRWVALGLAICGEIAGALLLRASDGFTRPLPTTVAVAAFGLALFLVSRVMKSLPVSLAYPIWAGGGTAGVVLLGSLTYGESLGGTEILGIVSIIAGVVLLNSSSEKTSGC